jgi:transposase
MERPPDGDRRDPVPGPDRHTLARLPERFGSWKPVYERHRRCSADGTRDRILRAVQADTYLAGRIDWSMVGVDSTSCRAHQHAAGARRKTPSW